MKTTNLIKAAAVCLLAVGLSVIIVAAGQGNQGNPGVIPPQASSHGQTYGQWSAVWWQWVLSIPADQNPALDPSGAYAAQGQSGPVWFLAGTFGSGTAERTVTVPPGKALFFPLINFVWISTVPEDPQTAEGIRALLEPPADAVTDLACEVDGVPLKNLKAYRTESPLFNVALPAGNVFGVDPATYGPAMDQGYYLMLAPLSVGNHTIHLTGSMPASIPPYWSPFSVEVTYHVIVER